GLVWAQRWRAQRVYMQIPRAQRWHVELRAPPLVHLCRGWHRHLLDGPMEALSVLRGVVEAEELAPAVVAVAVGAGVGTDLPPRADHAMPEIGQHGGILPDTPDPHAPRPLAPLPI